MCGQIYCHACSSKQARTAASRKPVRVCDSCYVKASNGNAAPALAALSPELTRGLEAALVSPGMPPAPHEQTLPPVVFTTPVSVKSTALTDDQDAAVSPPTSRPASPVALAPPPLVLPSAPAGLRFTM
jgi:hypothetical protein